MIIDKLNDYDLFFLLINTSNFGILDGSMQKEPTDIENYFAKIIFENSCFSAKNWYSFIANLRKMGFGGDKMETWIYRIILRYYPLKE